MTSDPSPVNAVDQEHVRRWERGPTEAACRHAQRAVDDLSLDEVAQIGKRLYEADRPVPGSIPRALASGGSPPSLPAEPSASAVMAAQQVMFDYGHDQPAASVSMMDAALRAAYRVDGR